MKKKLKKIPNISHIPTSKVDLEKIINFLKHHPVEEISFYNFLNNEGIINKRDKNAPINLDSTERKWKNHLNEIGIIDLLRNNHQILIKLSSLSHSYIDKNILLNQLIYSSVQHSTAFSALFYDLVNISYLSNNYRSVKDLYLNLQAEFGYIDRIKSATRNLTGMINYLRIGGFIKTGKTIRSLILNNNPFYSEDIGNILEKTISDFIQSNSKYGGYASINELINYLSTANTISMSNIQINLFLRRILKLDNSYAYQEASSNKETGLLLENKNVLFIRKI